MFKFFDNRGRILALRPDLTVPVARLAATKLKDNSTSQRIFYIGNTFRYDVNGGGRQKEFTQAGVEIHGHSTPESDAEVIATAINILLESGLENFQIDIGQVEFFKGIMEDSGLDSNEVEQIRVLIDSKDYLGVEELVNSHDIKKDLKDLILSLPGMFGNIDFLNKVDKSNLNKRSIAALENLKDVLEILDDYGLSKYVSVDLGMVQSIDYYTGIIFRGFTYGVGFPIVSGGRYDNLISKFGKNTPATGFSLGINFLMLALDRQKIEVTKPMVHSLVYTEGLGRKTANMISNALRKQGLNVEMYIGQLDFKTATDYAKAKNIGGAIKVIDENNIEIVNLEDGNISKTSLSELLAEGDGK